jgi:hypothetical protein
MFLAESSNGCVPRCETEKPSRDQRHRSLPVPPATPQYLCKVRRLPFQKLIRNQSLTHSVLNSRSRKVWRQMGR